MSKLGKRVKLWELYDTLSNSVFEACIAKENTDRRDAKYRDMYRLAKQAIRDPMRRHVGIGYGHG